MATDLVVKIFSFSFHTSGIPEDDSGNGGGFIFDCRCLPNPGRDPAYAEYTGKDIEVIEFLEKHAVIKQFLDYITGIIDLAAENYQSRNFANLLVAFGCTGGQHRSVYFAERLAEHLARQNVSSEVHHLVLES